ncbi:MAG: helix-turn-helix transcriptional regulator [Chloroflexi bacterium]|nr:helix-turn-helix transcriptional regulator [Chloroflexota bacterium]
MDRVELTQAALETLQAPIVKTNKTSQHEEARRLRGKIVGVLIRIYRLEAQRSLAECAGFMRAEPQLIEAWEHGEETPSLPELELLAVFLNGGAADADGAPARRQSAQTEYLRIRRPLIGVMLRAARISAGHSQQDVGASAGLEDDLLERFELGEAPIPVSCLDALAQAIDVELSAFLVQPQFLLEQAPPANLAEDGSELEAEWRQFTLKRENQAFIRLAMAFQQMARADLHRIADALLAIIKTKGEVTGWSGSPS